MINSVEDHVHILFSISKNIGISQIVKEVKTGSSKWIKTKGEAFRQFHWQSGYGAFSVTESHIDAVKKYIANQEEHHRKMTFQEEFVQLLKKHHIEYDERYLWD